MIRLLHNLIAVREAEGSDMSPGGIQLPTVEKQRSGTVVSVGPGVHTPSGTFIKTIVQEGDEIIYTKEAGEEVEIDGEVLRILPETNVIGIVKSGK